MGKRTIELSDADWAGLEREAHRTGHASAQQYAQHLLHEAVQLAPESDGLGDILGDDHKAVLTEVRRRQDTPLEDSIPADEFFERLRNRIAERTGRRPDEVEF
ncbi:MAG: hypothetical protein AAGD32_08230 [Planctomycetota bacterium]